MAQSQSGLKLYDNFDGRIINPSKWIPLQDCVGPVMECVREVEDDHLRLRVRDYGATDTNDGSQQGITPLGLAADSVTDIAADLTVTYSAAQACSTNSGFGGGGHAQVLLWGRFFNGGLGTFDDDLQAFLQIEHYATTPAGKLDVAGQLLHQGQFFSGVDFGLVNVGERVRVELVWDQPNHQFIVRLSRPRYGTTVEQFMPYTISDTTPPAFSNRVLSAAAYGANCVGSRKSAEVEVLIDDVLVK
jgi:hypothetical protein